MSHFPRRSARLSAQQQPQSANQHPTSLPSFQYSQQYSPNSSTSTTSHPSPTNDTVNGPLQYQQQARLQLPSQFLPAQTQFNAPLPSPSAAELESFFGRAQVQQSTYMAQQSQQNNMSQSQNYGFGLPQQQNQQQFQQANHHHNSFSQPHRPNMHPSNSAQLPQGLPPDFLAEAAKRARWLVSCVI